MVGVEEARHNVGMVYEPCSHFVAQPVEAEDHAEDQPCLALGWAQNRTWCVRFWV